MKRALISAAVIWIGTAVLFAQARSDSRAQAPATAQSTPSSTAGRPPAESSARQQSSPVRPRAIAASSVEPAPASAADAATYRAWLNQYCVGCHSNRSAQPANEPLNLESASL